MTRIGKTEYNSFYDSRADGSYPVDEPSLKATDHYYYDALKAFIDVNSLKTKKSLEIGCRIGIFQDLVDNYNGVDISEQLRVYHRKNIFRHMKVFGFLLRIR